MNYQDYTSEDFALDPVFRKWVLQPTVESNLFWEQWLRKYPEKASLLLEARSLVMAIPTKSEKLPPQEVDELWMQIKGQIENVPSESPADAPVIPLSAEAIIGRENHRTAKSESLSYYWNHHRIGRVAAAASVLLAFLLSFWVEQQTQTSAVPELVWVTKENPWGQRSTVYLSDGTLVHLNAGSRIRYQEEFSATERLVQLRGEAFFEVKKDTERPFRVLSASVITEALGTSFNVRAFDSTPVEVALVTGKVKVSDQADKKTALILSPGQGARRRAGTSLDQFSFDPESTLAWKEGEIFLKDANEKTVFTSLEHWYGVKITARNKSKNDWNYSASYRKKSLEHILTSMSFVMDFDFQIQQKQVIITYH